MSRIEWGLRPLLSTVVALVVASVALSSGMAATPATAAAAPVVHVGRKSPGAPTLTPASPVVGEAVRVAGRLPTRTVRPVSLQRRNGTAWSSVAKGRTTGRGAYAFELAPPPVAGASGWRVHAKPTSVRIQGTLTRLPALTSAVRNVTSVDQALRASIPSTGSPGQAITAVVSLSPARPGRGVSVERLLDGSWQQVAASVQGSATDLSISVPQPPAGPGAAARTDVLRIVAGPHHGIASLASAPSSVAFAAVPPAPDTEAPPPPRGLSGVAGDGQVSLSWAAVTTDDLVGYAVYRAPGPTGPWTRLGTTVATAYVADGLVNGTEYAFAVASRDAAGNESGRSAAVLATPVVMQTGTLTLPGETFVNKQVTATATFGPALQGRAVQLQVLDDGSWSTVAEGTQDDQGVVDLPVVALTPGSFSYRAVALALPASPAAVTATVPVTVAPDPVVVDDDVEPLSEAEADAATYSPDTGTLSFGPEAPASVAEILAGDVVVLPPRAGLPAGALLRVTQVHVDAGGRTLTTTSADLPDVVSNVPDDASDVAMAMLGRPAVTSVADGVTIRQAGGRSGPGLAAQRRTGQGLISLDGDPIEAAVELRLTKKVGPATLSAEVTGSVIVTPTVELGLDMDWATLRSYRVGAGFKIDEHLGVSASVAAEVEWSKTLFKVSATRGGFIGPVPVWATVTGKVVLTVTADGQIKAGIEWNRNGTVMVGLEGSNHDQYLPHPFRTVASSQGSLAAADAVGHLHGEIIGSAQLDLYSLAGPFAEVGYEADGTIRATTQGPLACELFHRPIARIGLRTSDALKKLTGRQFTPLSASVSFAKTVVGACPGDPPSGPPQITTTSLHDATLGRVYSVTLQTADHRPGIWSVVAGSLPPGLVLDADTGELDGTVSSGLGSHQFTVSFDDQHGGTVTRPLSLLVATDAGQAGAWVHAPAELPATPTCWGCIGYELTEDLTLDDTVPGYWFNDAAALVVPAGRTLTITAGARLKLGGCYYRSGGPGPCIWVRDGGTLRILGSADNPVEITAEADDQLGGDTNGDGPSEGGIASYHGIDVQPGGSASLVHVRFRYAHTAIGGGGSVVDLDHVRVTDSIRGVSSSPDSLAVTHSVFDNTQYGVLTYTPDAVLRANTYRRNIFAVTAGGPHSRVEDSTFTDDYIGITASDVTSRLSNNRFGMVGLSAYRARADAVPVIAGTVGIGGEAPALSLLHENAPISGATVWDVDVPIQLTWSVRVLSGGELRLPAGTRIRSNDCRAYPSSPAEPCLTVAGGGRLTVLGRQARPVIWTSLYDDSVGGDIGHDGASVPGPYDAGGIALEDGAMAEVSHLDASYVGNALRVEQGAELSLDHSSITQAGGRALVAGGLVHVDATAFDGVDLTLAVSLSGPGSTLTNSWVSGAYRGVQANGPGLVIGGTRFEGLGGGPALENLGASQVDARSNWWGNAGGPTGSGPSAQVVGDVLVAPWCTDSSCGSD